MQNCVRKFIECRSDSALILVDIGVWPFHDLLEKYPDRAKNIGIFEPGTVSLAAGLSLSGIVPTVYGISPFLTQRSLEQIKLDFAYQKTGGNFIVTGASYDFSTLGYSHYCPEDVATLRMIPGVEILTPGTPSQFERLWNSCHDNGKPSYFRMTDHCNKNDCVVDFGKASVIKRGNKGLVIAVAETLDLVLDSTLDLDVTVLYYTTICPFDEQTLKQEIREGKIFICSPFYEGSLVPCITKAFNGVPVSIFDSSIPLEILRNNGSKAENDEYCGLTVDSLKRKMKSFFN